MKLLLPTSIELNLELPANAADVELVTYDSREPIPAQHRDAEAIVTWALPPHRHAPLAAELPNLRWVQGLMAGTDALEAAGFGPAVTITGGIGLHDRPVAEHTVGMILAAARRFDESTRAQDQRRWPRELGGNQAINQRGFTKIMGSQILIWGFGRIGQTLADYLAPMGAKVIGVAKTAGERAGYPVITPEQLSQYLPSTDVLVSILPANAATEGIIDAAIIAQLPQHAWFVNVGRGAVVNEPELQAALKDGVIAGAALDVFVTEPLPAESPWYDCPNVIITPHNAGGRPQGSEQLIAENLRRYLAGEDLLGVAVAGTPAG